ncbi:hypothetical protein [Armatimonas sp.]|uniref:hypothetical protein n=1 Tax=Armatimonas sp. TaxID=1872638 RepID=UPI00286A8495|nr:hypothetical protein [Armatimonas sp.]
MSFEQDLARGRGRAVLHLQSADQATRERYREPILYACCHSQRYDTQGESERSLFLLDVLEVTQDIAYYIPHLRAALSDSTLYTDQLFGLCARLHRRGHADIKTDLYAAAEQLVAQGNYDWDQSLLRLGTAEAWQKIAALLQQFPPHDPSDWHTDYLYREAQLILGRRVARHLAPRALVVEVLANQRENAQRDRDNRRDYANYGEYTPEELSHLAEAVPQTVGELQYWLFRFRQYPFPHNPAPLLTLTYHEDQRIAWYALLALGNVTDPRIRARALELLTDPETLLYPAAVRLLAHNSSDEDLTLLTNQLNLLLARGDEARLHSFGSHFREYAQINSDLLLTPLLLTLYDAILCPYRRYSFVKLLLARNDVPTWLLSECRYDCNEDIRALGGV